ncbi:hypothetical protein ZIOFF_040870 [Zingiber officinale]|uniref:non-specific serine/threonine protein kinase n=1 Tax=Zingiber officinale TaxID=94328 RepID=A0A8J5G3Y7_ZINOF|nr:hypothetical protein ZIOFF_040870 [Zingiber officinale]
MGSFLLKSGGSMRPRRSKYAHELFLVAFLFSWAPSAALLSPKGVNYEVQALMGIKASLKDPHSVLENWDQDSVDPCSWTMVTCSSENLVIGLGTPSQNLSGTLSPSIGNLTNLEIVLLQNNNISGPMPKEIGRLSKLKTLDLSNNYFTGEIPSSISLLKDLQYLSIPYVFDQSDTACVLGLVLQQLEWACTEFSGKDIQVRKFGFSSPSLSLVLSFETWHTVRAVSAHLEYIVGNPLICAIDSEKQCFGMTPMPMSYDLNNSEILGIGILLWWKQRHTQQILYHVDEQHDEEVCLGNLKRFQFRELQIATDNFSSKNILGKGGFGIVYKGHLKDGTLVAVKRLKDGSAVGGEIQFQTEVEMISLAVHRNLLRLCGFCMTGTERLLVYPYMSNGSVASRLKGKPPLDWTTRKRIALGAGRGLLYLHEQCDPKIIHRDVKAGNILLDDYCEAIVGDFGLAKLLDHRDSHVTTAVRGTVGHIAPEYLSTGQSSEKTDVFGFGILLLELITGRTALEFGKSVNQKGTMLDWVKMIHQEKKLDMLIDKNLKNNYDLIELEEIVQVALLCTQFLPGHRPKMSEVVRMLEGDGLVERWEASQRVNSQSFKMPEFTLESSSAASKTEGDNEEAASKNGEGFDSDGAVAEKTDGAVGEAEGREFPVEEEFEMEEFDWWRLFVVKTRMLFALPWERVKKGSVLSMKLRGQVGLTGSPAFFSLFLSGFACLMKKSRTWGILLLPRLDIVKDMWLNKCPIVVVWDISVRHFQISDQLKSRFSSGLSLPQICENFIKAAYDPRVSGIYLEIEPLSCGWAKIDEIRRHILNFKKSALLVKDDYGSIKIVWPFASYINEALLLGKFIVSYIPICGEKEYYLASSCGECYVPPSAYVALYGLTVQSSFLGGVLEKIGIQPEIQRIGRYKSAGDQLSQKSMSKEVCEMLTTLLDNIYENWLETISSTLGKRRDEIEDFLNSGVYQVERLKEEGYITNISYDDEVKSMLKKRLGQKDEKDLLMVDYRKYSKVRKWTLGLEGGKEQIAIIRASGSISRTRSPLSVSGSGIVSEQLIEKIQGARESKRYKAVILRIDSPGGDALASDLMWREIRLLAASKPVIATMSDVAASGGYYMAMAADAIVAEKLTLTGSIGVVTGRFSLNKLYERIGFNKEIISRGRYAELIAADQRPFRPDEAELFEKSAQNAYRLFRDKAAFSRSMPVERMEEFAQGRVWSGKDAASRGLVDAIGGFSRAVAIAKHKAKIPQERQVKLVEVLKPSPTLPEIITGIGNTLLGLDKTVKEALLGLNYLNGVQARIDGILFESVSHASDDNPIFMIIKDCLNSLL